MSDDESSEGSGRMNSEEAAEAREWMKAWKEEMEATLRGADKATEAATAASAHVRSMWETADRDREFAARSIELALAGFDAVDGAAASMEPKLTIALLIKRPALVPLKTFVQYHWYLGVHRFMFFFDDASNGSDAPDCNNAGVEVLESVDEWCPGAHVVVHRCNCGWWQEAENSSEIWDKWGGFLWSDVIARQVLALEVAIKESFAAAEDWLIHIDPDEALCFGDLSCGFSGNGRAGAAGRFFNGLPSALDEVVFLNHEAAPEKAQVTDWFKEVTLFKANPACGGKQVFVAYNNGKAAVRLADGVVPAGSHRFTSLQRARKIQSRVVTPSAEGGSEDASGLFNGPCLLHYCNCDYSEWKVKYEALGSFSDVYCGETAIPFEFHLASRDLIARRREAETSCSAADVVSPAADIEADLLSLYNTTILFTSGQAEEGLSCGNLIRTDVVTHSVLAEPDLDKPKSTTLNES